MTKQLKIADDFSLPLDAVTQNVGVGIIAPNERAAVAARLWAKVEEVSGCMEWRGYTKNGYGSMSIHDHQEYVHRLSYELHVGVIPRGMCVCHKCDNRLCISPSHFFLGTDEDNFADMRAKGRAKLPPKQAGMINVNAKDEFETVEHIRQMRGYRQRELAEMFGVSQSTIWRWRHGLTRKAA